MTVHGSVHYGYEGESWYCDELHLLLVSPDDIEDQQCYGNEQSTGHKHGYQDHLHSGQ